MSSRKLLSKKFERLLDEMAKRWFSVRDVKVPKKKVKKSRKQSSWY